VDAELIEAAEIMPKKKSLWKIVAVAAACLAVVLLGTFFLRQYLYPVTPKQVFGAFHEENVLGDATISFSIHLPNGITPNLHPLPESETIPLFRRIRKEIGDNTEGLQQWGELREQRLRSLLRDNGEEYDIVFSEDGHYQYYVLTMERSRATEGELELWLEGKLVQLDQAKSNEELIADIESVKEGLFSAFGVSFSDVKVVRRGYSHIDVVYYDLASHPINQEQGEPDTDRIVISWSNEWSDFGYHSEDERFSVKIRYYEYLHTPEERYKEIGKGKLIGLDKAEEMLAQGYGFGLGCDQCKTNQGNKCFHYDYVSFEYWGVIPVYAFYTFKGESTYDGSTQYSITYVCAVKVPGLERYLDKHM
jgi:hypothetical protein